MPTAKELALAAKVTSTAEAGLAGMEMLFRKYPAQLQAIMWTAVAEIAQRRAFECDEAHKQSTPTHSDLCGKGGYCPLCGSPP